MVGWIGGIAQPITDKVKGEDNNNHRHYHLQHQPAIVEAGAVA